MTPYTLNASQKLRSYALESSDISDAIAELTRDLIRTLMKLHLYPDPAKYIVEDGRDDVYYIFHTIPRSKYYNAFPSAVHITGVVGLYLADASVWWEDLQEDLDPVPDADIVDFENKASTYISWLAHQLSNRGQVSRAAVIDKLIEIGF